MHVACLLLSWCVVAHVLLLFPREKPLGINMVSVDVCMSTCGRCGTAFVYCWDRVVARTVWLPLLCRINTYTHSRGFVN